jgi:phenylalanyl-tRNA synthetase alpha chain
MIDKIKSITNEVEILLKKISSLSELEEFRIKYLSRKGVINSLFENFKSLSSQEKSEIGKHLNELKKFAQSSYEAKKQEFEKKVSSHYKDLDLTLPGRRYNVGSKHLISQALDEIIYIFRRIGFSVFDSPEIEDEYHNFDALNTPDYHPSRDMQDTFYLESDTENYLLRTHTSPGQIRVMEKFSPPVKVIVPGKCYRNEAISSRSLSMFHQIEGFYVDKNVTFRELQATLSYFAREFFGRNLKTRLRPSFFPFTEPSAEMDVECYLCNSKGCRVCKYTGWLEILGCGMIDPNVFAAVGYDSEKYTGYAFGMGLERTLMIKFGIPDIRMFYENDIRLLKQFR